MSRNSAGEVVLNGKPLFLAALRAVTAVRVLFSLLFVIEPGQP
jgi:hypothetical protein